MKKRKKRKRAAVKPRSSASLAWSGVRAAFYYLKAEKLIQVSNRLLYEAS
jgi:hypothetical protein